MERHGSALTIVAQDYRRAGQRLVGMPVRRIEDGAIEAELPPPRLVVRRSSTL